MDHQQSDIKTNGSDLSSTSSSSFSDLQYQSGFHNHFSSEALPGALPHGQSSPLVCPYGLYAEQIFGSSFTSPRKLNLRSWLYRVKPSVTHEPFRPLEPSHRKLVSEFTQANSSTTPTQLWWKPVDVPESPHRLC